MSEFYRRAILADGLQFTVAIGPEANDDISKAFLAGVYACQPLVELMLTLLKPDHRVLDLGAHIGTFSLAAAALRCEVLSVERSPRNYSMRQKR
jgi:tRNA/tmRNA/rRNA uracil-C5-methylase (TrmA/RlmC/RlmD family)